MTGQPTTAAVRFETRPNDDGTVDELAAIRAGKARQHAAQGAKP